MNQSPIKRDLFTSNKIYMKVIFLDHDGVICLMDNWGSRRKKINKYQAEFGDVEIPVEFRLDDFDKKSINVLNRILRETGAEIVVSSDWKNHATLDEMSQLYLKSGIFKTPIDYTPNTSDFDPQHRVYLWRGLNAEARAVEINKWVADNKPEKWVAVDDLDMSKDLKNFVYTPKPSEGIKQSGIADKIIAFLN